MCKSLEWHPLNRLFRRPDPFPPFPPQPHFAVVGYPIKVAAGDEVGGSVVVGCPETHFAAVFVLDLISLLLLNLINKSTTKRIKKFDCETNLDPL